MYRGYWIHCLGTIPYTCTLLWSYDIYRNVFLAQPGFDVITQLTMLGIFSTLTSTLICHPLDTIRRNIQADSKVFVSKNTFLGFKDCLNTLVQKQGWMSLWRGLPVTLTKIPLQLLVQVGLYENLKQSLDEALKY